MPAFKAVSAAAIEYELEGNGTTDMGANGKILPAVWGDYYVLGISNYVAFWLVMKGFDPSAAPNRSLADDITTKTVGRVTITRSSKIMEDKVANPFKRNIYGQTFLFYAKLVGQGGLAV